MIDVDALTALMAQRGMSRNFVAKTLGLSPRALQSWLKEGIMGSDVMEELAKLLKLPHPEFIFFAKKVTLDDTEKEGCLMNEDEERPTCPLCGRAGREFYYDLCGDCFGCDDCVTVLNYWEVHDHD